MVYGVWVGGGATVGYGVGGIVMIVMMVWVGSGAERRVRGTGYCVQG